MLVSMSVSETKTKKKIAKKISERYLRNAGEYYLNRFPASASHFMTVMTRKIDKSCREHPEQNRDEWINHIREVTIPYFQNLGFINDNLFAAALFNSLKNRGYSKAKIKSRMTQKGIPNDLIIAQLADGFNDKDAVILFAKKKKIGKFRTHPYTDLNEQKRDLGKLARAGFSYEAAISVF